MGPATPPLIRDDTRHRREKMSRAFVKEPDEGAPDEGLPERQVSEHANYVTPDGLRQLEGTKWASSRPAGWICSPDGTTWADQELAYVDRDLRYFARRLDTAIPVDLRRQPRRMVEFGAAVTVRESGGARRTFTIVGEDEADLKGGQDQLRVAARRGAPERTRGGDRALAAAGRRHRTHRRGDRLPGVTADGCIGGTRARPPVSTPVPAPDRPASAPPRAAVR